MEKQSDRILVALDTIDVGCAADLAVGLTGLVGGVKLGHEFFYANGPDGVRRVVAGTALPLFLDLKFNDIPNTVAGAVSAVFSLRPYMLNVHASGGRVMMRAAASAVAKAPEPRPLMLAVTVLTSLGEEDLAEMGVTDGIEQQVVRLAGLAQASGMDGVVCSAREITALRAACGPKFKLVVPGIRPAWAAAGDQKRVVTPAEAISLGADYLVIGRPITAADDPAAAARRIGEELASV